MQEVKIVYKEIKNIILKVKPSLEVVLSVPKDTSKKEIEYILHKRKEWIEQRLERFRENQPLAKQLLSGEDIYYLGKRYRLKVLVSEVEGVKLRGGYLEVSVREREDYKRKERLIKMWYQTRARQYFREALDKYSTLLGFEKIQTLRIKEMKTRWGSCNPTKAYINLNLALIQKNKRAIEYVVLHELAHLKYPHHNKDFYHFVMLYMPDWRERKLKLLEGM